MSDILFAHPKSIHLLNVYPYILIMDSTCKTNRYLMPLFEVVGVAPTGKIFTVAFVFLKNEKEDSYTWALEHLKLLIDSDDFPKAIVTDRELALVNALETYSTVLIIFYADVISGKMWKNILLTW